MMLGRTMHRSWALLAVLLCVSAVLGAGKTPKRPKTVRQGASGFGGGSADLPGHGKIMHEVGKRMPVDELTEMPSWETFYEQFVRANRPVVLRGAARSQPAFQKWSDEYLLKLWGSRLKVDAELKKVEERGGPSVTLPFDKFLKEIYREERKDELFAVIGLEDEPEALADIDLPEPVRCTEIWPQSVTLWMSAGGTMSVLHTDDAENFLMMVDGRKSVMLVHQDYAQDFYADIAVRGGTSPIRQDYVDLEVFPRFANITWLYGEIGPGDTLYIPHSYWHQVNSRDRNLGVNIWWSHKSDWKWFDLEKFDSKRFGTSALPSFDKFKARADTKVRCTAMPEGQHMDTTRLVDEGKTKKLFQKQQVKARKMAAKARSSEL